MLLRRCVCGLRFGLYRVAAGSWVEMPRDDSSLAATASRPPQASLSRTNRPRACIASFNE